MVLKYDYPLGALSIRRRTEIIKFYNLNNVHYNATICPIRSYVICACTYL